MGKKGRMMPKPLSDDVNNPRTNVHRWFREISEMTDMAEDHLVNFMVKVAGKLSASELEELNRIRGELRAAKSVTTIALGERIGDE